MGSYGELWGVMGSYGELWGVTGSEVSFGSFDEIDRSNLTAFDVCIVLLSDGSR